MVLRPVGPLPPGVYWFRRLLVLLVIMAVFWAGYRWLGPSGDDPSGDGSNVGASSTPTPSPTSTSPSPTPTPTDTSSPTKQPTKTSSSPALATCAGADIVVAVTTDAESYGPGVDPLFTLTVTNESDEPCLRDLGPAALELRVSSGGARIWSSDDCNPNDGTDAVRLEPGEPYAESVSWARQASQPGCPADQPDADPGQYQVIARNLKLISDPAVFTLE